MPSVAQGALHDFMVAQERRDEAGNLTCVYGI